MNWNPGSPPTAAPGWATQVRWNPKLHPSKNCHPERSEEPAFAFAFLARHSLRESAFVLREVAANIKRRKPIPKLLGLQTRPFLDTPQDPSPPRRRPLESKPNLKRIQILIQYR
jgi:hypothetical protein